MDKMIILESMHEVIQESLEWGIDCKEYGYFVDGVVAVVDEILDKMSKRDKEREAKLREMNEVVLKVGAENPSIEYVDTLEKNFSPNARC